MFIQSEPTPNPDVLKFIPGVDVLTSGVRDFREPESADASPLAAGLFQVTGVQGVFLAEDFLTVRKSPAVDWSLIKAPVLAAIMDHFISGAPVLTDTANAGHEPAMVYEGEAGQIVAEIKDLLDTRIRPAVARDGGDIVFSSFDLASGTVYLEMRGACSGCPSSSATLKSGVENMLKHYIPEVVRVEPAMMD